MLADIQKVEHEYIVRFERNINHSIKDVWSILTVNEELMKWFPQLSIVELRTGGTIKFDFQDGSFKEMEILDCQEQAVLEFTWAEDIVRFELYPDNNVCKLLLIEKIKSISPHSPKDLAGWHVCLEVIQAILDGESYNSRQDEWKIWYERYKEALT